ncbi:MAG: undecaprenyl-diphosphate phosphatase [Marmoricola sp.]
MTGLSYLQAVVIGALQGITELFPISSLGHSVLVPAWIGGSWNALVTQQSTHNSEGSDFLSFVVALHVATALALLLYFWRTWLRLIGGVLTTFKTRKIETQTQRLGWLIVIATIPVGILGLALEHTFRTLFAKPEAAAIFLTINGVILFTGERLRRRVPAAPIPVEQAADTPKDAVDEAAIVAAVSWRDAIVIGLAQSLALLAGISRSGITMVAGLLRGLDHETSIVFSFLLATPVIFAAGVLKIPSLFHNGGPILGQVLAGSVAAFLAALFAIKFLTKYFENRSLYVFAGYCLVAGVVSIVHFA